jgi:hypothetical protein
LKNYGFSRVWLFFEKFLRDSGRFGVRSGTEVASGIENWPIL